MTGKVAVDCPRCRGEIEGSPPIGADLEVACAGCGERATFRGDSLTSGGGLSACAACGCADVYRQKDFNRKIGLAVVLVAAVLAPFTLWNGIPLSLVAAAAIDAALYLALGEVVVCYRCRARHRGFAREPRPASFDVAIHDRYRFPKKRGSEAAGAP